MITEDYVSFEVAKLLKEKGFDEYGMYFYTLRDEGREGYKSNKRIKEFAYNSHTELKDRAVSCPTIQMAMKWLRELHNIFIGVNTVIGSDKNWGYEVFIQKQEVPIPSKIQWDWFNTYKEACEAAIKYCLENLI